MLSIISQYDKLTKIIYFENKVDKSIFILHSTILAIVLQNTHLIPTRFSDSDFVSENLIALHSFIPPRNNDYTYWVLRY